MNYEQKCNPGIEIPFGAKDSELKGWEYTIPEGMEAIIKDGKVIIKEKKSEDEKIRQSILRKMKACQKLSNFFNEKEIAYLEKQKEQKHPNGCFTCDEYKKGYEAGRSNGFTAGYNKARKEQKPAEWSDTNELVFQDICKHLKEEGYNGWIVLLNALHNGEFQPKQEWSEEDEKVIDTIVSVLGQYIDYKAVSGTGPGYATPRYSKEIDWLKSLRPSWRPSEEQMSALVSVTKNLFAEMPERHRLESLHKDLKKLM